MNIIVTRLVALISRSNDWGHFLTICEETWNKSILKLVLFLHFEKKMLWKLLADNSKNSFTPVLSWIKKITFYVQSPSCFFLSGWHLCDLYKHPNVSPKWHTLSVLVSELTYSATKLGHVVVGGIGLKWCYYLHKFLSQE